MTAQRMRMFQGSGTAAAPPPPKAAAEAGREIVDLSAGEIWTDLAPEVRAGAIRAIDQGVNRYTDTLGLAPLRAAVARRLATTTGSPWRADDIAMTSGAKQALFNAMMALIDPGDEVIIPAPCWTTFPAQIAIAGGTPVLVDTRATGFHPRAADIEAAITPATRMIVLNSPCNPTGAVFALETMVAIAELALERDLWILLDECYASFMLGDAPAPHLLTRLPEARRRVLLVNSFSKSLGLTGWRLGYLAAPSETITAVKALQGHSTSNPNVIAQHAVLAHLAADDGAFERGLRETLARNRTLGLERLSRLRRVPPPPAEGGFYFYLDLATLLADAPPDRGLRSADDVAALLLAEAGVATVSGVAFGDPAGLRVSFGADAETLDRGLERLVAALNGLA